MKVYRLPDRGLDDHKLVVPVLVGVPLQCYANAEAGWTSRTGAVLRCLSGIDILAIGKRLYSN